MKNTCSGFNTVECKLKMCLEEDAGPTLIKKHGFILSDKNKFITTPSKVVVFELMNDKSTDKQTVKMVYNEL